MNIINEFIPGLGVQIESTFSAHVANCEQCKRFDANKPASVSILCLGGAVLWKQENAVPVKREPIVRLETWVSKKKLAAVMRYKA